MVTGNIVLKKGANQILTKYLKMNEIKGDIENWAHNIKRDFYGQAARNMQALIQKFARTINSVIQSPTTRQKLNYLSSDMIYLVCEILGDKDLSRFSILYDENDRNGKATLNGAANISKHSLEESRFCAKQCAKAYNKMVERIQNKLNLKNIGKFQVDEKNLKDLTAPTTNYNYLKPIPGEPDYDEKKKRQDELFAMFKRTLLVPDDYYVQMKAIKYQRDAILKEELDSKWNEIRKDHMDHSSEMEYIMNSIGDHTYKINYLINSLLHDHINSKKALSLAKKFLKEEINRNDKIISYTRWLVDAVKKNETRLISSTGVVHTNTTNLEKYVVYKLSQNEKLNDKLFSLNNI
jgi:hypothetical protein